MGEGMPSEMAALLAIGPDDVAAARRPSAPGAADPYILRSLLRQERTLDTIAALLTEIRDRLPDPSTLIAAEAILAPVAPEPIPPPHTKRQRGS